MSKIKTYLNEHPQLKEIIEGGGVPLLSKIGSVAMVYFFYLYISRVYGAEVTGIFSVFLTIITLLSVFSKMGFDTSIVKRIAFYSANNQLDAVNPAHQKISLIVLSTSLILSGIIFILNERINLFFFDDAETFNFLWLSITLPFFSLYSINMESLRGLKKMGSYAILQNVSLFSIAFISLLFYFNSGLNSDPIFSFCVGVFLIFVISYILFKKNTLARSKKTVTSKDLLKESFPMLLSNSAFYLMTMIDILMISYFLPESETGIYTNAAKIANLNIIFLFAINSIAAPKLAEFNSTSDLKYLRAFTKETSRLSIILSLPIFIIIILFPDFLLSLFGQEFTDGKYVLITLGLGQFFNAIAGSVISVLNMTGKQNIAKNIILSSTLVNLILNFILIPKYGIIGAGIATGFTTILWNALGVLMIYKQYKFISMTLPWQKVK